MVEKIHKLLFIGEVSDVGESASLRIVQSTSSTGWQLSWRCDVYCENAVVLCSDR